LPDNFYKAQDGEEFYKIIRKYIRLFGNKCNLNWIDTSDITNMHDTFWYSKFNGDISKWNTSNVTDMNCMFYKSSFNGDISKWDVSNGINMNSMFAHSNFNRDISDWDVSNVKDMGAMFYNAKFNGDLSKWNVSSNTDIGWMFYGRCKIKDNPPKWYKKRINEGFDFGSIEKENKKLNASEIVRTILNNISNRGKLSQDQYNIISQYNAIYKVLTNEELKELIDYIIGYVGYECSLNWIDVSNITDMSLVFGNDDIGHRHKFNGDISKWNVSNVKNMM
jgi:surface protein